MMYKLFAALALAASTACAAVETTSTTTSMHPKPTYTLCDGDPSNIAPEFCYLTMFMYDQVVALNIEKAIGADENKDVNYTRAFSLVGSSLHDCLGTTGYVARDFTGSRYPGVKFRGLLYGLKVPSQEKLRHGPADVLAVLDHGDEHWTDDYRTYALQYTAANETDGFLWCMEPGRDILRWGQPKAPCFRADVRLDCRYQINKNGSCVPGQGNAYKD